MLIKVDNLDLLVPEGYALSQFQSQYRLYDRFLPELVKYIDNGVIVDVGANVGDTLYSIIQNCDNEIVCFEASEYFFDFLSKNLHSLPIDLKSKVRIYNYFIGTDLYKGDLQHTLEGTAKLIDNYDTFTDFKMLDNVISKEKISLIKIDTDGYDFDVLSSALEIIKNDKPVLYWENYFDHNFQFESFNNIYSILNDIGYHTFYIFDNFGNLILSDVDINVLRSLNMYLKSMILDNCTKTFYYIDILAVTVENKERIQRAIDHYSKKIIFK